jgi:hypothetical protein
MTGKPNLKNCPKGNPVAGLPGDIHDHNAVIHPELMPVEYLSLRDRAGQSHNSLVDPLRDDQQVTDTEDEKGYSENRHSTPRC